MWTRAVVLLALVLVPCAAAAEPAAGQWCVHKVSTAGQTPRWLRSWLEPRDGALVKLEQEQDAAGAAVGAPRAVPADEPPLGAPPPPASNETVDVAEETLVVKEVRLRCRGVVARSPGRLWSCWRSDAVPLGGLVRLRVEEKGASTLRVDLLDWGPRPGGQEEPSKVVGRPSSVRHWAGELLAAGTSHDQLRAWAAAEAGEGALVEVRPPCVVVRANDPGHERVRVKLWNEAAALAAELPPPEPTPGAATLAAAGQWAALRVTTPEPIEPGRPLPGGESGGRKTRLHRRWLEAREGALLLVEQEVSKDDELVGEPRERPFGPAEPPAPAPGDLLLESLETLVVRGVALLCRRVETRTATGRRTEWRSSAVPVDGLVRAVERDARGVETRREELVDWSPRPRGRTLSGGAVERYPVGDLVREDEAEALARELRQLLGARGHVELRWPDLVVTADGSGHSRVIGLLRRRRGR